MKALAYAWSTVKWAVVGSIGVFVVAAVAIGGIESIQGALARKAQAKTPTAEERAAADFEASAARYHWLQMNCALERTEKRTPQSLHCYRCQDDHPDQLISDAADWPQPGRMTIAALITVDLGGAIGLKRGVTYCE